MSEILDRNISRKVSEVSPTDIKILIAGFLDEANRVMGHGADDQDVSWLIDWTTRYVTDRYNYMPVHHLRAAIEYGALGERGGTSKLMPRNIAIWVREQANILQEVNAQRIKAQDDKVRQSNFNSTKANGFVAAAVRMKVSWLADSLITSDEYDSFSSKAIYDLLSSGRPEKTIHPREVVPEYDLHRQE